MTSELPPQPAPQQPLKGDVLLYVEQEAPSKFKIESDQLEKIGAKLRGPRRFSIFYSLVLPALVTLLTTILTGTFQYLSWINTVRLQAASAVVDRAAETFDKAAVVVGQRSYATLIFIPSVRDLSKSKRLKPSQPVVAANDKSAQQPAATSGAQFDMASVAAAVPNGTDLQLNAVSEELAKQRYVGYYEHLKRWNEQYDQLLADIDYNLDHPILADAGIHRTAITVFYNKLKKID
jgi:hypothetical protein